METLCNNLDMDDSSFKRIAQLESSLELQKTKNATDIEALRKDLKAAIEKIDQLMGILDTLESLAKLARLLETAVVWVVKLAGAVTVMYGMYKFGLTEVADKIKALGGK